jgi:PAS domain S-box-containing protein
MGARPSKAAEYQKLADHLDRVQQMSDTGSWEWDIATNGLLWSPHIFRIFGLVPDAFEPTYPRFLERVHPDDRHLVQEGVARAIAGIETYDIDHRIVLPDGTIRVVHEKGDVEYTLDGRPIRMLGAVADVTEVRASMQAAQRTQEMLSSMLQISPEAIIVSDAAGRIQLFSAGAQAMFGYLPDEVVGLSVEHLIPVRHRRAHHHHLNGFAAGTRPTVQMHERSEIHGLRKNGEEFPAEASLAKLQTGEGYAFTTLVRDLSAWKANEQRLIEARREAERANLAKSTFLANMSHEIRTPLNGVLGVAAALARTELGAKQVTMVELIETSARALDGLLGDILDLAKVDSGRMSVRVEPFDLGTLILSTLSIFRASAADKGVNFGLSFAAEARGHFLGDDLKIRQILSNLLSNAVKFTDQGVVRVMVSAPMSREGDCRIRIAVEDTGIGFPPQYSTSLFERFQQADGSITRRYGGTGLGLAITKSLIDLMGGTIEASSEASRGATFTFELPLKRIAKVGIAPTNSDWKTQLPSSNPIRILVAEDHAINRQTIQMILDGLPVELTCVENGEAAVQAAETQIFDLIFMDIQMPVMDGLTAIRLIREREAASGVKAVPICVLTAFTLQAHRESAEALGVDAFLTKPIDVSALINLVETVSASQPALAG